MNINQNKLTRTPLRKSFQKNLKINEKEANYLLEKILDHFHKIFLNTKDPHIKISSFGTFIITNKKERIGRNPRTLEKTIILPRRKITFRSSKGLIEKLNPPPHL
ncbi:HU family DNA-binding protein [Holospora undulata]|uniref:Integration host factor subunit alpha n=1 Tax=Holospora undulata HU1 TaxID=1321371 RepID=A0A061JH42_9PROT|nr:HU family DNA-binding protein [Holospora undulata]ETZ05496.1 integration host factor subunit alpha [Holospora undulata HU1]